MYDEKPAYFDAPPEPPRVTLTMTDGERKEVGTEDPPRLTVKHTLSHAHDAAWAVLRDIRAWYWPDQFHGLPTNWAHRWGESGVVVSGAGTWTHAYLPIFPWFAEPVAFTLDVDDTMHVLTIAEVPADPRTRKREHTQKWSVASASPHTCVLTVELWHAPTPLIGWYAHPLLSRSAKAKMKRVEALTVTRADLRGEHRREEDK